MSDQVDCEPRNDATPIAVFDGNDYEIFMSCLQFPKPLGGRLACKMILGRLPVEPRSKRVQWFSSSHFRLWRADSSSTS